MTTARDHLSKADTVMIAAVEAGVPMLVEARYLVAGFHSMIRKKLAAVDRGRQQKSRLIFRQRHRS